MVTSGLRDAGYVYVNIDDCWMERRDEHGVLQPFSSKFPSGMKVLADYVHRWVKQGSVREAGVVAGRRQQQTSRGQREFERVRESEKERVRVREDGGEAQGTDGN